MRWDFFGPIELSFVKGYECLKNPSTPAVLLCFIVLLLIFLIVRDLFRLIKWVYRKIKSKRKIKYKTGWVYNQKTGLWEPPKRIIEESHKRWTWDNEKRIWIDQEKQHGKK